MPGGGAPVRVYLPELLDKSPGAHDPGLVFEYAADLDEVGDAYPAMDERRAIKSLVRVGTI